MALWSCLSLLAVGAAIVHGASFGTTVSLCDARSPLIGCSPGQWTRNDRLRCTEKATKIMHWAAAPVGSRNYRLWAGPDGDNMQLTVDSYTPGDLVKLHLRALDFQTPYLGIMLYAVDANNKPIGSWEIPSTEPKVFVNDNQICGPTHLFHATAEDKFFHTEFNWRAPNTPGLGKITFRCLLKEGPANEGYFYWPNNGVDLALNEKRAAAANPNLVWVQSQVGQTCDQACATAGTNYQCNATLLAGLDTVADVDSIVGPEYFCTAPYLSSCSNLGPSTGRDNGFCYFYDRSVCGNPVAAPTCDARSGNSANGRRMCACTPRTAGTNGPRSAIGDDSAPASINTKKLSQGLAIAAGTTTGFVIAVAAVAFFTLRRKQPKPASRGQQYEGQEMSQF